MTVCPENDYDDAAHVSYKLEPSLVMCTTHVGTGTLLCDQFGISKSRVQFRAYKPASATWLAAGPIGFGLAVNTFETTLRTDFRVRIEVNHSLRFCCAQ